MRGPALNARLLCAFHGLQMSLFPMAIISVFFTREIGMSVADIMWLQGAFGFAMVLFEFPSGYLADRIGYRRSLVLASALQILGWSVYVSASSFAGVVAAEAILGAGLALVSGTDTALLYESLRECDDEATFAKWSGRMRFWGQCGEASAALVAGALFAFHPRLPFAAEILVWSAAIVCALLMVEPARRRPPLKDNFAQMYRIVRHVVVESPRLGAIFQIMILLGLASFIPVWTIQIHATDGGLDETWLGPFWAGANYLIALAALGSHRLGALLGRRGVVLVCVGATMVGYFGLGLIEAWWGFLLYYAIAMTRGLFNPILEHDLHRLITSEDRAGFVSLRSFLFRGSFLLTGPIVGHLMDDMGQRPVLMGIGAVFTVLAVFSLYRLRRTGAIS